MVLGTLAPKALVPSRGSRIFSEPATPRWFPARMLPEVWANPEVSNSEMPDSWGEVLSGGRLGIDHCPIIGGLYLPPLA